MVGGKEQRRVLLNFYEPGNTCNTNILTYGIASTLSGECGNHRGEHGTVIACTKKESCSLAKETTPVYGHGQNISGAILDIYLAIFFTCFYAQYKYIGGFDADIIILVVDLKGQHCGSGISSDFTHCPNLELGS